MKQLTKISLFLSLAVFAFTSCNNSDVTPASDDASALVDFMFLATANDSTTTKGDHNGKHGWRGGQKCNVTEVAVADLPAAITAYISKTYEGSKIDRAGKLDNGNIIVKITKADATHSGLVFDATGTFVEEKTHKAGGHGTPVDVTTLSATIKNYIATNYAGGTIEKAATNTEGKFFVVVKKADGTYVGVGFNADGSFISEMTKKGKGSKSKG